MSTIEKLREELLKTEYKSLSDVEVLEKLRALVITKPEVIVLEEKISRLQELEIGGQLGPSDIEKARA